MKTIHNDVVSLETAKILKQKGYNAPCKYYYQTKDLPFSKSGLKWCKNDGVLNHNGYNDFIYSAPFIADYVDSVYNKL